MAIVNMVAPYYVVFKSFIEVVSHNVLFKQLWLHYGLRKLDILKNLLSPSVLNSEAFQGLMSFLKGRFISKHYHIVVPSLSASL